jgi:two-component system response regulator PilR (NtrC family)
MSIISPEQVLVISPEAHHHEKISQAVQRCGLASIYCTKIVEARSFLARQRVRMVFCHDTLPDGDFRAVVAVANPTPVVVLSRFAEWDYYVAALRAGAFDYLACPPDPAETERIVWSAIGTRH